MLMAIDDSSVSPDTILEQNLEQSFVKMGQICKEERSIVFLYFVSYTFLHFLKIICSMLSLSIDGFLNPSIYYNIISI